MRDVVARRAPELLEQVTELVGEDPFARVEENTRFAQPAIFCASLAGWDALGLHPSAAAGHSLGELAALAAAGVLAREDALELVVLRGRLMGEARNGSMLALVGASLEDARAIAGAGGVIVANDNAPGQVVLSGSLDALERTEAAARRRRGPRRSTGWATTCRRRSSRTATSPSASGSTTTGSSSAPASTRAAGRPPTRARTTWR
jgi:[acyl-carrier-protein] S-malonyltransferase